MEFNSLNELKERLSPALEKRESDLNLLGFSITKDEIWKDLALNKWKNEEGLALSDMVDDILKYMKEQDSDVV